MEILSVAHNPSNTHQAATSSTNLYSIRWPIPSVFWSWCVILQCVHDAGGPSKMISRRHARPGHFFSVLFITNARPVSRNSLKITLIGRNPLKSTITVFIPRKRADLHRESSQYTWQCLKLWFLDGYNFVFGGADIRGGVSEWWWRRMIQTECSRNNENVCALRREE